MIHLIGNVAVWVALAASAGFCGLYAFVPWRRTVEGWHLMTFTGVLAVAFAWIAYRLIVPPTNGMWDQAVRAAILGAIALLLVWRFLLLVRAQTRRRRKR